MRGIHSKPLSMDKMRRIKRWHRQNECETITISTERSFFDEVEIIKIIEDDAGRGWVEFVGLDYRGYREWLIQIDDLEEVTIS
jgi:hypothetical protein